MIEILKQRIPGFRESCGKYAVFFKELKAGAKTILLHEGETARKIFYVKEGCLRMAFDNRGRDLTIQFFFENQPVASLESFMSGKPSQFKIETVEASVLTVIQKENFESLSAEFPEIKEMMSQLIYMRLSNYSNLFISFIKNTPEERYIELLKNEPQIIQRIPQHYIASYLGITSVSLSRIRNRILKCRSVY